MGRTCRGGLIFKVSPNLTVLTTAGRLVHPPDLTVCEPSSIHSSIIGALIISVDQKQDYTGGGSDLALLPLFGEC